LAEQVDSIWGPCKWIRPRGCVPIVIGIEPDCSGYLYHVDHVTIIIPVWPILLLHYGFLCLDP
jgi:hypothetical protein